MSVLPVPGMRSTVTDGPEGLTFVMPTRSFLPFVIVIPIWLAGWSFGEFDTIRTIASGHGTAYLAVWLTGWTVGGLVALSLWAWMMFGRERLVVGNGRFVHAYGMFGLFAPSEYDVQAIHNLRANANLLPNSTFASSSRGLSFGGGAISFEYGGRTVCMGAGIDEAEGRMIVRRIRERVPITDFED